MGKVSESIFNGKNVIVPMADVQHIEKQCNSDGKLLSISIITKHTTWILIIAVGKIIYLLVIVIIKRKNF